MSWPLQVSQGDFFEGLVWTDVSTTYLVLPKKPSHNTLLMWQFKMKYLMFMALRYVSTLRTNGDGLGMVLSNRIPFRKSTKQNRIFKKWHFYNIPYLALSKEWRTTTSFPAVSHFRRSSLASSAECLPRYSRTRHQYLLFVTKNSYKSNMPLWISIPTCWPERLPRRFRRWCRRKTSFFCFQQLSSASLSKVSTMTTLMDTKKKWRKISFKEKMARYHRGRGRAHFRQSKIARGKTISRRFLTDVPSTRSKDRAVQCTL